jgi:monoamine oxidase
MPLSRRDFLLASAAVAASGRAIAADTSAPTNTQTDVLVIGAGLAGLWAAITLQDADIPVTVLEAQQRVGGKILTFSNVPGMPEAGGQTMGPGYGRLINAAQRFGVKLVDMLPQLLRHGDTEFVLDGRVMPKKDWPASPRNPFPPELRSMMPWDYVPMVTERANPIKEVDTWYEASNAVHDVSMYEFLRRQGATEAMIELAYDTNASYGTTAHDISALQMFFSSAWGKLQRQMTPAAMFTAEGGNQRITDAMARALKQPVRLGSVVTGVMSTATGVTVHCADGSVHQAKAAICALPFSVTRQIRFDPVLSGVQAEAIKTLPHEDVVQIALVSKKPFWKDDGLSPMMWSDGLLARSFPVRNSADDVVSILVTVYSNKARILDRLGREAACRRVIAEIEAARPAARGQLRAAGYHSWGMDPYAAGDWAVFRPGTVTRFLPAMNKPHGRIHFCGEQTALANRGMEGAMESGERAALEVFDYF